MDKVGISTRGHDDHDSQTINSKSWTHSCSIQLGRSNLGPKLFHTFYPCRIYLTELPNFVEMSIREGTNSLSGTQRVNQ